MNFVSEDVLYVQEGCEDHWSPCVPPPTRSPFASSVSILCLTGAHRGPGGRGAPRRRCSGSCGRGKRVPPAGLGPLCGASPKGTEGPGVPWPRPRVTKMSPRQRPREQRESGPGGALPTAWTRRGTRGSGLDLDRAAEASPCPPACALLPEPRNPVSLHRLPFGEILAKLRELLPRPAVTSSCLGPSAQHSQPCLKGGWRGPERRRGAVREHRELLEPAAPASCPAPGRPRPS